MSTLVERIETILTSEYSVQNYVEFVREVFAGIELVAPDRIRKEYSNFSSHIAASSHIGNYIFPDGKKLIVFSVQLLNKTYVEGSRSTQRSYAKKLIENANADAAIIAFYTEGDPKWRVSLVRLDYEMTFENGRLKTAENMTPAKRYSYLVGQDEPCHTAIDRFRKFITDATDRQEHPTLDELEEAFSVEAVTNEFFALYCEKFQQLREHLERSEDFRIEAEQHNFTSAQFAKKLMGQIVFLYFLQKKGWLGVSAWPNTLSEKEYKNAFYAKGVKSRQLIPVVYQKGTDGLYHLSARGLNTLSDEDETVLAQCVKGQPWGTGPRNFMRRLFEFSQKRNGNFFDDYLEPLFYNALNVNRGEQGYDPELHCRIPFLSGGLFDPIDGYEWKHNIFAIPNDVFSNRQGNNARTGDGILDIFDRYNFTMSEDEPLEREVAIDPEMLGKVFENLLEVNDRKSKGAFYTPREIVHYMCQESIIHYLTNTLNVSESAIRDFILYGDFMKDEDTVKDKRQGNGGMFISEELYKVDATGKVETDRLVDIDNALKTIRVADPAVGSGAFPLGMLNEIVRARQNITAYMAISMNAYDTRMMYSMERSPHSLKYETIKNCIFAADVEPSAVDITQLRLWLSLVIDDEINPDATNVLEGHRNPLPLPNLECNVLCGNSLSEEFEGIPLVNQSKLIGTAHVGQQGNLFQAGFDSILPHLIDAQDRLFRCDDTEKKKVILKEISDLRDMIVMSQLEGRISPVVKERYEASKIAASKPYVLWHLDFARVFREKGGFDIVIGNPPYLESRSPNFPDELKDQLQTLMLERYGRNAKWFPRGADLLIFFFELSLRLINPTGLNTFITQNSWLDTEFGKKFQEFLLNTTNVLAIVDSDYKYFETADINTVITFFEGRSGCNKPMLFARCHKNLKNYSLPANSKANINKADVTYKVIPADSDVLHEMKWGFIFNTEDTLFSLISKANEKGKTIEKIANQYEIGQGLNLKKSAVVSQSQADMLGIPYEALIPFFTTEEAQRYVWNDCDHFIVKKSALTAQQRTVLKNKIDIFDDGGTRKIPPVLMMPRGIGARHYSCINGLTGYSASGVELYAKNGTIKSEDVLRMWIYTNSSLFWLIREIAGRKNLGGGMLKAEAVDIKPFAILFDFPDIEQIRKLAEQAKTTDVLSVQEEVNRSFHKNIDSIVFDYIGFSKDEREYVVNSLVKLVDGRYSKTKAQ